MDRNQKMAHFLAYAVLVCCGGMALCLSLLAFTLATGDLPFGIQPFLQVQANRSAEPDEIEVERERLARERYGEVYAARLYSALHAERERVAAERRAVEERRLELEEFEKAAALLKKELQATADRAQKLIDEADAVEKANVRRLSSMLAASDPAVGARLLLRVPVGTAARLIQAMDSRRSGEVMAALAAREGKGEAAQVGEILTHFQKLAATSSPEMARKGTP